MAKKEFFHIAEFNPLSYDAHQYALDVIKDRLTSTNIEFEVRESKQVGDTFNLYIKTDNIRLVSNIRSEVVLLKRKK